MNSQARENYLTHLEKQILKSHGESEYMNLLKTTTQTDNLKVVIRVRPSLPRERENDVPFRSIVIKHIIKKHIND